MTLEPWVHELIPFVIMLGGIMAWFIRLEAKGLANEKAQVDTAKSLDKLDVKVEALDNRIVEKLSYIERSLAKIEGRLSIDNDKQNRGE